MENDENGPHGFCKTWNVYFFVVQTENEKNDVCIISMNSLIKYELDFQDKSIDEMKIESGVWF